MTTHREETDMSHTHALGIDAYLRLIACYPHLTHDPDHQLPIVTDRATLLEQQELLYRKADASGKARIWFDLGIVAQDPWVVVLRDLVQFPNGSYGGYIRTLNRKSQIERSGKDVVVLVTIGGKVLLMKHFRHDDRQWHWECPRGFGEAGLSPAENARKEVQEETGLEILNLRQINGEGESIAYFHAECRGNAQNHDQQESIAGYVLADEAMLKQMLANGQVSDPYTVRALILASLT